MKLIASMTVVLALSVSAAEAHERAVRMTFSGNGAPSPANLQEANATTGEENVEGRGTLGKFYFRNITTETNYPQPSVTCSGANKLNFLRVSGAGIFRFEDGSLLRVKLTQGNDCVDLAAQEGQCTLILEISGGTGRFKDAGGTLTLTETATPVLADANHNPIFFTEVGEITGTISGLNREDNDHDQQQ